MHASYSRTKGQQTEFMLLTGALNTILDLPQLYLYVMFMAKMSETQDGNTQIYS